MKKILIIIVSLIFLIGIGLYSLLYLSNHNRNIAPKKIYASNKNELNEFGKYLKEQDNIYLFRRQKKNFLWMGSPTTFSYTLLSKNKPDMFITVNVGSNEEQFWENESNTITTGNETISLKDFYSSIDKSVFLKTLNFLIRNDDIRFASKNFYDSSSATFMLDSDVQLIFSEKKLKHDDYYPHVEKIDSNFYVATQ